MILYIEKKNTYRDVFFGIMLQQVTGFLDYTLLTLISH